MERIYQRIGRIREHLSLIRSMKEDCLNRFMDDPVYRGAILHYLYILADSCIVLAELVGRHKKLRPPQSYHEAIDILGESRILEPNFACEFSKIAGFRNFLAHDYGRIEARLICEEILSKMDDVDKFLEQIENSLK